MPTLGPHVPLKSMPMVRPRGTSFISESMLAGAQYLESVMCHGTMASGRAVGASLTCPFGFWSHRMAWVR